MDRSRYVHFWDSLKLPIAINRSLTNLSWLACTLTPVVPGQPIPLAWNLRQLYRSGLAPGDTVKARVFLDAFNALLYESNSVALVATPSGLGTEEQHDLIPPPAYGGVANELYRIGDKLIRIEVTVAKSGDVFTSEIWLEVVPAYVAGFEWRDPQGTTNPSALVVTPIPFQPRYEFLINHDFTLLGRINNTSANPNISIGGSLTLLETPWGSSDTKEIESVGFLVGPSAHQDITFKPLKKDWTWLISSIWVRNFAEPLSKSFNYFVRYSFSDNYGNAYNDIFLSNKMHIAISVSDEKSGYASGALAALGIGIIAAIFSFGVGLSVAQALAGGLGRKALDPPAPDPRFKRKVIVGDSERRQQKPHPLFGPIIELLDWAEAAFVLIEAMDDTHNRLLGARHARDRDAVNLQLDTYQELKQRMLSTIQQLCRQGEQVARDIVATSEFARDDLERILRKWQRSGIPRDVLQSLIKDGCSDEDLSVLAKAVEDQTLVEISPDLPQLINVLTYAVSIAAFEHGKRSDILLHD